MGRHHMAGDKTLLGMSLRSIGGGYKELLMVLTALHGCGADTVLLDSPGFSLHPPQQKALALWISKFLYLDNYSRKVTKGNPSSVMIITNSTEFVTEDSLPCLYCFRRIVQSCVRPYMPISWKGAAVGASGGKQTGEGFSTVTADNSSLPSVGELPIYEKPSTQSRIVRVLEASKGEVIYCRGGAYGFLRLANGTGYAHASLLCRFEENGSGTDDHLPLQEMVTRVRSLQSSDAGQGTNGAGVGVSSDVLKILDPSLKRLVFATGVFFFEGQSDYRVIEALKHVANGVTWEIVIMHGAGEIPKVVKIVDMLSIPYGIVVDFDQVSVWNR